MYYKAGTLRLTSPAKQTQYIQYIMASGSKWNVLKDKRDRATLLDLMIRGGMDDIKIFFQKLHRLPLINEVDEMGLSPVHLAAMLGRTDLLESLLGWGGRPDIGDSGGGGGGDGGKRPLLVATQEGHISAVEVLLDHGAEVNYADESGYTALHYAAEGGYDELCEILIASGADVHRKDKCGGHTPIHLACITGWPACVEVLLEAGADPLEPNDWGRPVGHCLPEVPTERALEIGFVLHRHLGGSLPASRAPSRSRSRTRSGAGDAAAASAAAAAAAAEGPTPKSAHGSRMALVWQPAARTAMAGGGTLSPNARYAAHLTGANQPGPAPLPHHGGQFQLSPKARAMGARFSSAAGEEGPGARTAGRRPDLGPGGQELGVQAGEALVPGTSARSRAISRRVSRAASSELQAARSLLLDDRQRPGEEQRRRTGTALTGPLREDDEEDDFDESSRGRRRRRRGNK